MAVGDTPASISTEPSRYKNIWRSTLSKFDSAPKSSMLSEVGIEVGMGTATGKDTRARGDQNATAKEIKGKSIPVNNNQSPDGDPRATQTVGKEWEGDVEKFLEVALQDEIKVKAAEDAKQPGQRMSSFGRARSSLVQLSKKSQGPLSETQRSMAIQLFLFLLFFIGFVTFTVDRENAFAGFILFSSVLCMLIHTYRLITFTEKTVTKEDLMASTRPQVQV